MQHRLPEAMTPPRSQDTPLSRRCERAPRSAPRRRRGSLCLLLALALVLALPACSGRTGPSGRGGVYHHVARGENLYRIGLRYGVSADEIARANQIRDVTHLSVGQRLYIPRRGSRPEVAAKPGGAPGIPERPPSTGRPSGPGVPTRPSTKNASSLDFIWPVRGKLTSKFGRRGGRAHEGIDIRASTGTPIQAAEAGRVIYSGWMRGYGKVVVVKHKGRYSTLYAHASRLLVKKDAFVERGDRIALVGNTGRSTAPHLHFEIRVAEKARNPLPFLP